MVAFVWLCLTVLDPTSWWKSYADPVLEQLIQQALIGSREIRRAAQRVVEARALTGEARSENAPSLAFGAGAQQLRGGFQQGIVRLPQTTASAEGATFVAPFETGLLSSSLDARWEVSFWGPNAKRLSAARAGLEEQIELEREARLIVAAEVARAYFELRGFERQIEAARRNRGVQSELVALTQERARAGLAAELDAERQASALALLDAAVPPLELQRAIRVNRLGLLIGDRELVRRVLSAPPPDWKLPPLGPGIDSELLRRRPDVRAAEAQIQGALAKTKAARSELYPRVILTGLMGRQSTTFSGLSLGGGNFFGIGPQLVLPLFSGGRIRANIQASDARLEQAKLAYEQELSAAFQEAEDAIAGYRLQQARLAKAREAVSHQETALRLQKELYQAGLGDYFGVLEAERSLLQSTLEAAQAEADSAVQSVLLYKALAGGWPSPGQAPAGSADAGAMP